MPLWEKCFTTSRHLTICINHCIHLRSEAINHVSVSDDDKIQPAATSLPSCGHTHFVTPRLQQLSHWLQLAGRTLPVTSLFVVILNHVRHLMTSQTHEHMKSVHYGHAQLSTIYHHMGRGG